MHLVLSAAQGTLQRFRLFFNVDETLNPSGLSLPFGCTDSHGLSSGRILCKQFSVHPNHPKMGMYLGRMNLTQACVGILQRLCLEVPDGKVSTYHKILRNRYIDSLRFIGPESRARKQFHFFTCGQKTSLPS